ncbi:MAG: hypothetical protein A2X28_06860 [Elusimicrobia bacterium GWA2_56_46]|nr:MAG: hypothetical protein A2X28_06860 [Elusimicrobia bacterium GWA2_56_46]OGR54829.1 MAG: hypothetical protein A2X39_11130 [Elusimicrobia bacterium GWC2_56_31]HBW23379.1 hypothetical protein [Elusimicrobiota bacterium]
MKKTCMNELLLISTLLTTSAAAQNLDGLLSVKDIAIRIKSAEISVPIPFRPKNTRAQKQWTIMVFMNGKNDLSGYVTSDMNEMEKFGPTENINIVTQAGRMREVPSYYPGGGYDDTFPGGGPTIPHPGWPSPNWLSVSRDAREVGVPDASANWTGVRRYLVAGDGDNPALSSTMLADLGKVDMGDYRQLIDFGNWAKRNYPAKRYMLIVWNHGTGWKDRIPGPPPARGISYDYETGNAISTVDLGRAVRGMGGVDIYASDACLMQMAEVAYELKDAAGIIVGSEETEPADGWSYDHFLAQVHANKTGLTPEVMAAAAVDGYKAFYEEQGVAATQSALRASGLEVFRILLDQWAEPAMKENPALIKKARDSSTGFRGTAGSRDLIHFLELVRAATASADLKARTSAVIDHLRSRVILHNGATGARFANAYGVAAYLPSYRYEPAYDELAWAKEGGWDDFVKWITAN